MNATRMMSLVAVGAAMLLTESAYAQVGYVYPSQAYSAQYQQYPAYMPSMGSCPNGQCTTGSCPTGNCPLTSYGSTPCATGNCPRTGQCRTICGPNGCQTICPNRSGQSLSSSPCGPGGCPAPGYSQPYNTLPPSNYNAGPVRPLPSLNLDQNPNWGAPNFNSAPQPQFQGQGAPYGAPYGSPYGAGNGGFAPTSAGNSVNYDATVRLY
jgi:hypothetical protein